MHLQVAGVILRPSEKTKDFSDAFKKAKEQRRKLEGPIFLCWWNILIPIKPRSTELGCLKWMLGELKRRCLKYGARVDVFKGSLFIGTGKVESVYLATEEVRVSFGNTSELVSVMAVQPHMVS